MRAALVLGRPVCHNGRRGAPQPRRGGEQRRVVHLPYPARAGGIAPHEIGLAGAVDTPCARDDPGWVDVDRRAMYWCQERDGMWMRVALLVHLFGVEGELSATG